MEISNIEDTAVQPTKDFGLSVKNGKVYFNVGKDKHVFGSKAFPVGKRGFSIFTVGDTLEGDYDKVVDMIERSNWKHKDGHCYTNADVLHQSFKAHGVDAKYYSGWVFIGASYPIHHAWVVVDGDVYDISVNTSAMNLMQKQMEDGRDPYSKECVREVKELQSKSRPIKDHFTWGKVYQTMIYIGSEETPTSARIKYNSAMDKTPNHPSYRSMSKQIGTETHFKTRYQHLLDEV